MSNKLNIFSVVKGHLSTLKNSNGKSNLSDLFSFFLLPIITAFICISFSVDFGANIIEIFVTSSSVFTGLLLNLLILVYDQKAKLKPVDNKKAGWQKLLTRHTLIKELYFNISYATVISLLILVISVIHIVILNKSTDQFNFYSFVIQSFDISKLITTPVLIFCCVNLVFTVLMIIKRIYSLLLSDVD